MMLYYAVYARQNTKYCIDFFRECIRLADADIVRLKQYDVDTTTSGTSPCQVRCLLKRVEKVTAIRLTSTFVVAWHLIAHLVVHTVVVIF